jgi:hypothetical protein
MYALLTQCIDRPSALTEHRRSTFLIFAHATTDLRGPATARRRVCRRAPGTHKLDHLLGGEAVRAQIASLQPSAPQPRRRVGFGKPLRCRASRPLAQGLVVFTLSPISL